MHKPPSPLASRTSRVVFLSRKGIFMMTKTHPSLTPVNAIILQFGPQFSFPLQVCAECCAYGYTGDALTKDSTGKGTRAKEQTMQSPEIDNGDKSAGRGDIPRPFKRRRPREG